MKYFFIGCFFFFASLGSIQGNPLKKFFKKADSFLTENVKFGKVNYDKILQKPQHLQNLKDLIQDVNLENETRETKIAFYINAYNLLVISKIVENYPIDSPFEIEGFYTERFFDVAGERLSLAELEEKKLLKAFKDYRIPFTLCWGTAGSFPLNSFAYKPEKINKQLLQTVKTIANSDNFIRIKNNSHRILFCEFLLSWQKLADPQIIIKGLNQLRKETIPVTYTVEFYPTDHTLNAVK
jgi:hypothetical protein